MWRSLPTAKVSPCGQVLAVAQMRDAEQALIDNGETVVGLMERAGRGAADLIFRMAAGRSVTVLAGPGNNGGDGFVIARALEERGLPVAVVAPLAPATDAARAAREAWGGVPVAHSSGHVLVDCLFGIGLTRPLSDGLLDVLLALSQSHDRSVALDLPSGVDNDTGAWLNDRLPEYDLTIALGAWKLAHWQMPAARAMGERRLVDIGIAPVSGAAELIERPRVYPPPADAHKYTRGLLAVVSGEMPGAALLAARAAMRSGAGYIKLLAERRPDTAPDELVVDTAPLHKALADKRINALLTGPGLGLGELAKARLMKTSRLDLPTICDADALLLLTPAMLVKRSASLVVTPHAGELAALCQTFGVPSGTRLEQVSRLAEVTGAIIVAKGPDTIIASPSQGLLIAPLAPSWLSIAGTGDVLAGIIASRFATGLGPCEAAAQGVWLHGEAARLAGTPFTPSDLIREIPAAYAACL